MKITKNVRLLAIIPMLTLTLMVGFGGDAAAVNTGTVSDGAGDHRHNLDTGQSVEEYLQSLDSKAIPVEAKTALTDPYFDLVDVQKASANSDNTFKAIFDVWAGDQNITDLKMLVTSDLEAFETMAGSFNAGDHSTTTVKIRATDPDSISGKIIDFKVNTGSTIDTSAKQVDPALISTSITPEAKSLDGSFFELLDMSDLGSDLYKVTLKMYAGPEGIPTGRILHASSDVADEFAYVPRIDANSYDWLSVIISADDPSTIRIE